MRKLTNDELANRTREANRRRSERARERLTLAGHAALTVWLPVGLRSRFVNEAAGSGMTINELAVQLIEKGMLDVNKNRGSDMPEPDLDAKLFSIPDPDTADLFATPEPPPQTPVVADVDPDPQATPPPVSVNSARDSMLRRVGLLLDEGLSGAEIARRMNAEGHRAVSGKELVGHNLLREYRAWRDKSDGSDSTAV